MPGGKCKVCQKTVYPMDPQMNLDGTVLHKSCAKCVDCQCQITLSNFAKDEGPDRLTLLCKTHYFKRFREGGAYLGAEKYQKKQNRELAKGDGVTNRDSDSWTGENTPSEQSPVMRHSSFGTVQIADKIKELEHSKVPSDTVTQPAAARHNSFGNIQVADKIKELANAKATSDDSQTKSVPPTRHSSYGSFPITEKIKELEQSKAPTQITTTSTTTTTKPFTNYSSSPDKKTSKIALKIQALKSASSTNSSSTQPDDSNRDSLGSSPMKQKILDEEMSQITKNSVSAKIKEMEHFKSNSDKAQSNTTHTNNHAIESSTSKKVSLSALLRGEERTTTNHISQNSATATHVEKKLGQVSIQEQPIINTISEKTTESDYVDGENYERDSIPSRKVHTYSEQNIHASQESYDGSIESRDSIPLAKPVSTSVTAALEDVPAGTRDSIPLAKAVSTSTTAGLEDLPAGTRDSIPLPMAVSTSTTAGLEGVPAGTRDSIPIEKPPIPIEDIHIHSHTEVSHTMNGSNVVHIESESSEKFILNNTSSTSTHASHTQSTTYHTTNTTATTTNNNNSHESPRNNNGSGNGVTVNRSIIPPVLQKFDSFNKSPIKSATSPQSPSSPITSSKNPIKIEKLKRLGGSASCPVCHKSVYKAEEVLVLSHTWHKNCFKCGGIKGKSGCGKVLNVEIYQVHDKEPYCSVCYRKLELMTSSSNHSSRTLDQYQGTLPVSSSKNKSNTNSTSPRVIGVK